MYVITRPEDAGGRGLIWFKWPFAAGIGTLCGVVYGDPRGPLPKGTGDLVSCAVRSMYECCTFSPISCYSSGSVIRFPKVRHIPKPPVVLQGLLGPLTLCGPGSFQMRVSVAPVPWCCARLPSVPKCSNGVAADIWGRGFAVSPNAFSKLKHRLCSLVSVSFNP